MSSLQAVFVRFSGSPYPPLSTQNSVIPSSDSPRVAIMVRYLDLLFTVKKRAQLYSLAFYSLRVSISLGSLVVPALLSLNQSEYLFWIIWTFSLLVSISNSLISIFRIDKKYFSLNALYKKIESEGWQFINLTGNYYSPYDIGHDSQIQNFSFRLENIYMKQADDEYRKNIEQNPQNLSSQDTYVPQNFIQNQISLPKVNAGSPAQNQKVSENPKTFSSQSKESKESQKQTTVVEITQERPLDEPSQK